jgi:hypothetical protein
MNFRSNFLIFCQGHQKALTSVAFRDISKLEPEPWTVKAASRQEEQFFPTLGLWFYCRRSHWFCFRDEILKRKCSVADPWCFGTDPDADLRIHASDLQDTNTRFFCLFLLEDTFTSFFKDKKSKRSHKSIGIKVLRTSFAWWWKDPEPYLWITDPDTGGPKTYGSGSATLIKSIYWVWDLHIYLCNSVVTDRACFPWAGGFCARWGAVRRRVAFS